MELLALVNEGDNKTIVTGETVEYRGEIMNGARFWMGHGVAKYINGLDAGFHLIDNGGGIRTVGYDRQLCDDSAICLGLWSNEDGFEDTAPSKLCEQSSVVVQCYNHVEDIWISDVLHYGTALECINWLTATEPNRMNDAEAHYAPILKLAVVNGESRNIGTGE
jgi:hypothetical protein